MAERKLSIVFAGDPGPAKKAFGEVESSGGRLQGKLSSIASGLGSVFKAAAAGAAVAAAGVAAFVKGGVDSLINLEKITAQTNAVIKSTGGAAGVSADHIASFADSIEKATGIEAESIMQGQNLLLTFTNIKNGVGEGNDVFDQATSILADMSTALGTDASTSAVQLGKALNDPIKGVTALSKVGVSFTEQQKAQIKAMAEAGDVAGAQKVILGELNKEFGGSAKAFGDTTAGKIEKLKNRVGDFQEALAAGLLPVIDKVTTWLADKLPIASDLVMGKLREWAPTSQALAAQVVPVIEQIGTWLATNLPPAIATVTAAFAAVVAWVQAHWPEIQSIISAVLSTVQSIITGAVDTITTLWANFGDNILSYVNRVWPSIRQQIEGALQVIRGVIQTITSLIHGDWSGVWDGIKQILGGVWDVMQGIVRQGIEAVRLVIGVVLEVIGSAWKAAWNGIKDFLAGVLDGIVGFFTGLGGRVTSATSTAWDGIKTGLGAAKDWIGQRVTDIVGFFTGLPGRISSAASGMWDGIKNAFRAAINWIIDAWNGLEFKIPGFDPPGPGPTFDGFTLGLPDIPRLHKGGVVPGGKAAEVLRVLQGGEVVLDRGTVDRLGTTGSGTLRPTTVHQTVVHVAGSVITERELQRTVKAQQDRRYRSDGPLAIQPAFGRRL